MVEYLFQAYGLMVEYLFQAYVVAVGFCAAGLVASFSQLVTGEPMRFGLSQAAARLAIFAVLVRVVAGPAIVMRNAVLGAFRGRAAHWLVLSTLISVLWSFFSGVLVLEIVYRIAIQI